MGPEQIDGAEHKYQRRHKFKIGKRLGVHCYLRDAVERDLALVLAPGQPSEALKHPSGETEPGTLKSDLGHAPDIAEAVVFASGSSAGSSTSTAMLLEVGCEEVARRAGDRRYGPPSPGPAGPCPSPIVAPDQPHRRQVAGLDLLEFPFWKIDHHESVRAIGKIENGLPFRDGGARAGRDRPDHMIGGQQHIGMADPVKPLALFRDFGVELQGERALLQHFGFEYLDGAAPAGRAAAANRARHWRRRAGRPASART